MRARFDADVQMIPEQWGRGRLLLSHVSDMSRSSQILRTFAIPYPPRCPELRSEVVVCGRKQVRIRQSY